MSNDKGELLKFKDSEELFIENIGDFDNDISHYEYESEYWYYKGYRIRAILDSICGTYRDEHDIISRNNNSHKMFILPNYKLEVGRTYTLCVTIAGTEYRATEKLLPPIEVTGIKYEEIKRFKSIGEGYHTLRIPCFELINKSEESKYFIASLEGMNSLTNSSVRLFSTENMSDTIQELQLSEYYYDPAYNYGDDDGWYIDTSAGNKEHYRTYNFYPISKNNYNYYKVIENQIKTDGGLYSPTAATPVTNFSGGNVYGQFIITSETYVYDKNKWL